jgi:hypothetical protein
VAAGLPPKRPTTREGRRWGTEGGNARVISTTCYGLQLIIEAASLDNCYCARRRHRLLAERHPAANERCGKHGFADRRLEEITSLAITNGAARSETLRPTTATGTPQYRPQPFSFLPSTTRRFKSYQGDSIRSDISEHHASAPVLVMSLAASNVGERKL